MVPYKRSSRPLSCGLPGRILSIWIPSSCSHAACGPSPPNVGVMKSGPLSWRIASDKPYSLIIWLRPLMCCRSRSHRQTEKIAAPPIIYGQWKTRLAVAAAIPSLQICAPKLVRLSYMPHRRSRWPAVVPAAASSAPERGTRLCALLEPRPEPVHQPRLAAFPKPLYPLIACLRSDPVPLARLPYISLLLQPIRDELFSLFLHTGLFPGHQALRPPAKSVSYVPDSDLTMQRSPLHPSRRSKLRCAHQPKTHSASLTSDRYCLRASGDEASRKHLKVVTVS